MAVKNNKTSVPPSSHKKGLFIGLSAVFIVVSFIYSYKLKWLGDDIFIGFRYVQNFVAGHGLVYNIGERVEGYTHFLWTILISLFSWLKYDPLITTEVIGILSSLGTLMLVSVIGYKISKHYGVFILPFITIALALNYDYNVWATSGLETSFFTFLLTSAFYTYFFSSLQENKKIILSGLYLCLALMTRPDTLLIFVGIHALVISNQLVNRSKISEIIITLLLFDLAFIFIYVPYFIWRYNYYGFIFPNTYYDKLGSETLFSKGFYYLWLYFKPHFTSFLILILPPLILFPLLKNKIISNFKTFITDKWNTAFLVSILIVYAYLLIFVAKVGGDFMHARFVIPMTPFIYFIIFYSVLKYFSLKNVNAILTVLLLCSFIETKIRFTVFQTIDKNGKEITTLNRDVADERWAYVTYLPIENDIKLGKVLNRTFQGIDAKLLVRGGQACLGYFANFNYEQEYHGLTDTLIAHSKIEARGRIGHEKHASYEYLQSKGIHFVFNRSAMSKDQYKYAELDIPPYSIRAEIITYDNNIIEQLKQRLGSNFKFTDFQAYLDYYIQNKLPIVSPEQLKTDYESFSSYYFKHNDDKQREAAFLNALNKK